MSKDNGFTQQHVDDMIGEAVIILLKTGGPITTTELLNQLSNMAKKTSNPQRVEACLQGIYEIKQSISKNYQKRSQFLKNQSLIFENGTHRYQYDTKH
ncbi:hypothetical protein [Rosenbergiella australiborealis]|uniref:hypothetical protein n=1 Tax=Rosenbergiella australiborealis TaxID=1544696 RepID=UPI001F4F0ECF|nr:hypothetical protein [Rosenbergiella australiborealis]